MFDPAVSLLSRHIEACVVELARSPADEALWARALEILGAARASEPELAAAIDARDYAALRAIVEQWDSGKRPVPAQDLEVMRRAMKAFRKSMKLTRLDDESKVGRNPMSSGSGSSILGIVPPARFTRDVWNELVRRGELRGGRQGIYELAKE